MPLKSKNIELSVIHHISHAIIHRKDISSLLHRVLEILHDDMNLEHGTLTLRRGNYLIIEASNGLSEHKKKCGLYKIGEGVTGKVGESGDSIYIPNISKDPYFLGKIRNKKKLQNAFICVAVKYEGEVIGTLSVDSKLTSDEILQKTQGFLEIVANILADVVATFRKEIEERAILEEENKRLKSELSLKFRPTNIIGNCNNMHVVYERIIQVANSPATVLVMGESGTGKELVAKAIHYASSKKSTPFVAVNCAALPENLIESELFGHEKGSFTGAMKQRKGRFEIAKQGTLFLDEIGDITPALQVKLLRVLQEKVFERVGGHEPIKTNARVVAATNKDLESEIKNGNFREDLYYRLNIFPIYIPPLRKRKSDIILLADHFLMKYNKIYFKEVKRITTPAINMLMSYHWPGNVRELENCIERAVLVSNNAVISACDLPPSLQTAKESHSEIISEADGADFNTMVASFERELIVEALKNNKGNVAAARRALKTTTRIIHYKIKQLSIDPKNYK